MRRSCNCGRNHTLTLQSEEDCDPLVDDLLEETRESRPRQLRLSSVPPASTQVPPEALKFNNSCWACALKEDFIEEPHLVLKAVTLVDRFASRIWRRATRRGVTAVGFVFSCILVAAFTPTGVLVSVAEASWPGASAPAPASFSSRALMSLKDTQRAIRAVGSVLVILFAALMANATFCEDNAVRSQRHDVDADFAVRDGDSTRREVAGILSGAIQCRTVSYDPTDEQETRYSEFLRLHGYLMDKFPEFHVNRFVKQEVVNKYSLLYTWKGSDPTLKPVMFCAHLDVVPAEGEEDLKKWSVDDPFSGEIKEDDGSDETFRGQGPVVWGRGAIDNKHNVIALLYAAERLISESKKSGGKRGLAQPTRTIVFAFGHDEEIGGNNGAKEIAKVLRARKFKAEFVLDEGPFIIGNVLPGLPMPIAMIANREKGACNFKLTVDHCPSGHSSAPPHQSNVGILANAISRLERSPFPAQMDGFHSTFSYIASQLPFLYRIVINNMWAFGPIVKLVALNGHRTASVVRTTTSVSIVQAGKKVNTVPGIATAYVNHRLQPSDAKLSAAERVAKEEEGKAGQDAMYGHEPIRKYDERVIRDKRVKVELVDNIGWGFTAPSPVSSISNRTFLALKQATRDVRGAGVPVSHMIMTGNTDTRHYWDLTESIYRHSSIVIPKTSLDMFHGYNERLSSSNLVKLAQFYEHVMRTVSEEWED